MASFRVLDQAPVYLNFQGKPVSLGSLSFFDTGQSITTKDVFGDKALTVNNGAVVSLDSSGRTNVDVWGDGSYRVILKDALGATIWTRDDVEIPGGLGSSTLPAFVAGYFLTNDGAVASWAAIRQLPDPTGNSGKQLGTDGTIFIWEDKNNASSLGYQVVTAITSTVIDLSLGTAILLNQAVDITTLSFINPPSATRAYFVSITRVKDATGTARAISNLALIATWPGGAPTLTQTASAQDQLSIKFEPSIAKGRGTYALNQT